MNLSAALTLLFVLLFCCCNSGGLEKKIADNVKERCRYADNCTVRITELTNFTWDRMYVFSYRATRDDIRHSLRGDFPQYTEFTRKIVFLKDGKIIYKEEYPEDIEGVMNGEVVFDIPDNSTHKDYTPDTAVFNVTRRNFEKGTWFELKQKNSVISNWTLAKIRPFSGGQLCSLSNFRQYPSIPDVNCIFSSGGACYLFDIEPSLARRLTA